MKISFGNGGIVIEVESLNESFGNIKHLPLLIKFYRSAKTLNYDITLKYKGLKLKF